MTKLSNKKRLIYSSVGIAVVVILTLFLAYHRPVPLGGQTRYEPVLTGSMEPAISVGSVVLIEPVDPETLAVGDVICFKFSESTLITHRIVEISDTGFTTKGDANEEPDLSIVRRTSIVGKVILVLPYIGYLNAFVRTTAGFILLLVVPALAVIIFEVRHTVLEVKRINGEETQKRTKPANTQEAQTFPPT